jgi:lipopolysaccharide biosynthesis glycosyltransferase
MLSSLLCCSKRQLKVFVLHDDLTEADQREIFALFPEVEFEYIKMDISVCKGFPTVKRYPFTIYYRIFAPLLLPEGVERVLYLDCDLVAHNSFDEFYDSDFCGSYFIACSNTGAFLTAFNRIRMGVAKGYVYMNTGVVLMNVKALRQVITVEGIRNYTVKNKPRLMLYDQDVLFGLYGDRIKKEDFRKYNLSDRHFSRLRLSANGKIDEQWVEENNVFVHYIGTNKPWKDGYRGVLDKYYHQSAAALDERLKARQVEEK